MQGPSKMAATTSAQVENKHDGIFNILGDFSDWSDEGFDLLIDKDDITDSTDDEKYCICGETQKF